MTTATTSATLSAKPPGVTPIRGVASWPWYSLFFRDQVACLRQAYQTGAPVLALGKYFSLGSHERLYVLVNTPELTQRVLTDPEGFHTASQATIQGDARSSQRKLRYGLTMMNGESYERHRKLIAPVFYKKAVDAYVPRMAQVAGQALDTWPLEQQADLWMLVRQLSLRISSIVLFDHGDAESAFRLGGLINEWMTRNFSLGARILPLNIPGLPYQRLMKSAQEVEKQIRSMIQECNRQGAEGKDVLSVLVRSYKGGDFYDGILIGQATILFGASYETVAHALMWTLFLVAQHPDVARQAVEEVDDVLAGAPPTVESLGRLEFLEMVIKESMRILPPVPYMLRKAAGSIELAGLTLKRGDRVITSPYIMHHRPEVYAEPERFLPERWRTIDPSPFEYMPFGAGPRLCIGYVFAMTELKLSLALILQRFRITVVPNARIDRVVRITMGPRRGMPVTIHKQDGQYKTSPVRGNIHDMVDLPRL